jgi:hypothetical protein
MPVINEFGHCFNTIRNLQKLKFLFSITATLAMPRRGGLHASMMVKAVTEI